MVGVVKRVEKDLGLTFSHGHTKIPTIYNNINTERKKERKKENEIGRRDSIVNIHTLRYMTHT